MQIISTYRLQFHKAFTFADATAIVPYLHDLGITHVYASPYMKAVGGSTHGYDVIDQNQLNPELGTPADYERFSRTLTDHGMSHILDIVPNHMGVETNENQWWNDVLAHGRNSPFANFFDITWDTFSCRPQLTGKLLMPVLGEPYADALKSGKLQLKKDGGRSYVCYYDRRFPIDPASNPTDDLPQMLDQQHYRLSDWHVAADEINYRRFFDISGLAALQMQRQEVFDAVHRYTFQLIADGKIAGLRVDHPDGLLDPRQYFDRLQEKFQRDCPRQSPNGPLYVSVEKILNGDERLPTDWNVAGTSGYDFLCRLNDLFVHTANESAMTSVYEQFVGDRTSYADWIYHAKRFVLDHAMYSEMHQLTSRLDALAQSSVDSRDFTRRQLHEALREIVACFPVYRSYVSSRGVSESDVAVVAQAVSEARARNPELALAVLDFIQHSVLQRYPVPESAKAAQLDFAQRFQQLTSPVNAKGIEDSTFYIYNRLVSLNEVGGDPGRFGRSVDSLHRYFTDRQAHWPRALSSLSTHDTKRSEDVRARLNVLSEIPDEWANHVKRWHQINADLCGAVHPNDLYLLYQTLLGAWPLGELDIQQRGGFAERISAYMQKATREAKLRSSWINPNLEYESAITDFIQKLLDPEIGRLFLDDFLPFQRRVSRLGLFNSLSQTVIRLTAPGICDTYQGTELWDFSLVDPDNRRPVDYVRRSRMLADNPAAPGEMTHAMEDGRIKLWTIRTLLHLRRKTPSLFLAGSYQPLAVHGARADHCFAFSRAAGDQWLIVVVIRLPATLMDRGIWSDIHWEDTRIELPADCPSLRCENILTGQRIDAAESHSLACSELLSAFPVAALLSAR